MCVICSAWFLSQQESAWRIGQGIKAEPPLCLYLSPPPPTSHAFSTVFKENLGDSFPLLLNLDKSIWYAHNLLIFSWHYHCSPCCGATGSAPLPWLANTSVSHTEALMLCIQLLHCLKYTMLYFIQIHTHTQTNVLCRCTLNLCGWPVNQIYQHLVGTPGPKKHLSPWPTAAGWLRPRAISQQTLDTSRSSLHIRWNNWYPSAAAIISLVRDGMRTSCLARKVPSGGPGLWACLVAITPLEGEMI